LITGAPFSPEPLREHYRDLPGFRATLSVRASILNRAEFIIGSPCFVYDDVAFRGDDPFGSQDNSNFRGCTSPAHTFACLRIALVVAADGARLASDLLARL